MVISYNWWFWLIKLVNSASDSGGMDLNTFLTTGVECKHCLKSRVIGDTRGLMHGLNMEKSTQGYYSKMQLGFCERHRHQNDVVFINGVILLYVLFPYDQWQ